MGARYRWSHEILNNLQNQINVPTFLLCCDIYVVPEVEVACKMIFGPKKQKNINYRNNLDRYMKNDGIKY